MDIIEITIKYVNPVELLVSLNLIRITNTLVN